MFSVKYKKLIYIYLYLLFSKKIKNKFDLYYTLM